MTTTTPLRILPAGFHDVPCPKMEVRGKDHEFHSKFMGCFFLGEPAVNLPGWQSILQMSGMGGFDFQGLWWFRIHTREEEK